MSVTLICALIILAGASALADVAIWLIGGLGIQCGRALVEIGPLLVIGFYLSLQPFLPGRASAPLLSPRAGMAIGAGLSLLGAVTLRWDLCDPLIAATLLVFGPAVIFGQSFVENTDGHDQGGRT